MTNTYRCFFSNNYHIYWLDCNANSLKEAKELAIIDFNKILLDNKKDYCLTHVELGNNNTKIIEQESIFDIKELLWS